MQWKYKVVAFSDDAQKGSKQLDRLGSIGWELVAIHRDENGRFAYLKLLVDDPKRVVSL